MNYEEFNKIVIENHLLLAPNNQTLICSWKLASFLNKADDSTILKIAIFFYSNFRKETYGYLCIGPRGSLTNKNPFEITFFGMDSVFRSFRKFKIEISLALEINGIEPEIKL